MPGSTTRGLEAAPLRAADGPGVDALAAVHEPVGRLLAGFLGDRIADLRRLDPALEPIGRAVAELVAAGGKRLRPAFVYWGYRATGADHTDGIMNPAAAVELLHTFALIHDDVMDRSAERRGRPAVHTALAASHACEGLRGDPDWFGVGGAILAGDLAFVWADQLLDEAALAPAAVERARRVFTELRVEVMAGQYLDLRLAGLPDAEESDSMRVALLKSGRYTVTRPLQLGAALGAGDEVLDAAVRAYGDALGVAFQLRDDVLGLFGDPSATGKGALEDLREGKRTMLVLRALELAEPVGRQVLEGSLGNADLGESEAERVRQVIVDCGALQSVERLLAQRRDLAFAALEPVREPARGALRELADLSVSRAV